MFDKNIFIKYYITDSGRFPELCEIFGYYTKDCTIDFEIENKSLTCLNKKISSNLSYTSSDKRCEFTQARGFGMSGNTYKLSIYQNSCDHTDKYEKRIITEINKANSHDNLCVTVILFTEDGHMYVFLYDSYNISASKADFEVAWYHYIPETASYFDNYDSIDWSSINDAKKLGLLPDDEGSYKTKFKSYEELFSNQKSVMDKSVKTLKG